MVSLFDGCINALAKDNEKEVKQAGTIDENIAHYVLTTYPETANSFSTKCFHIDTLWSTKSMLVHEES